LKRKLFIIFDFKNWKEARSWSYISSYLIFEEYNKTNQDRADLLAIPHDYSESKVMDILNKYLESDLYDHCIIWIPHLKISKDIGEKLSIHKIKISYFITESLVYTEKEIIVLPHLKHRMQDFMRHYVQNSTVYCFCKKSHEELKKNKINSTFFYGYYPKFKKINKMDINQSNKIYSCAANLYNQERVDINNSLRKLLIDSLGYKDMEIIDSLMLTDNFNNKIEEIIEIDNNIILNKVYLTERIKKSIELSHIRSLIWIDYLNLLKKCDFVVNLPSYFKGLPGRVIESLYIDVPCISINSNLIEDQQKELEINGITKNIYIDKLNINVLQEFNEKNLGFVQNNFLSLDRLINELEYSK
jgi:hypothetical protein